MPTESFSRFITHSSRPLMQAMGFASEFIETSQGRIHAYSAPGSGKLPPVVVFHGFGTQAAELYRLLRRLRRYSRRLIAVDLPMHGHSETPRGGIQPDVLDGMFFEAVDKLLAHSEPVLLFGNSLGGNAALRYYLYRPEAVRLMVLSSPAGAGIDDATFASVRKIFAELSQQQPDELLARLYNRPMPVYRWFAAREIRLRFARPELKEFMNYFRPEFNFTPEQMQSITVPTLVIWGQQDRILENQLDFFKQHMPSHVRFLEPSHYSHAPYLEHALELAHQIASFAMLHCPEIGSRPDSA